eukprot:9827873-Alexandrium_andersonii.AAC.1
MRACVCACVCAVSAFAASDENKPFAEPTERTMLQSTVDWVTKALARRARREAEENSPTAWHSPTRQCLAAEMAAEGGEGGVKQETAAMVG